MSIEVTKIYQHAKTFADVTLKGASDFSVHGVSSFINSGKGSLTWIKPGYEKLNEFVAQDHVLVVCNEQTFEGVSISNRKTGFLVTEEPRFVFSRIANHFFTQRQTGIHPSASIHPDAAIGNNCFVGPFTSIGRCVLGNNVVIQSNCSIYDNVTIGNGVIVHAGVVIGADGFGYTRSGDGVIEKFPHHGGVVIGNDVEIGANTCIDRGALDNTVIGDGVRIDNLVHIAHNVTIGENAFIIAKAMIGGSTRIGKNAWIAPSASILQQLVIGDDVVVGMGSVVLVNIPSNEVWAGVPAKKIK